MATEVAQLLVRLEARVDGLSKGLDQGLAKIDGFSKRSTRSFGTVGRSVRRMIGRFTGIGTALAGIASIAGFGALAKGAIDAASAIDTFEVRLSNVLGSIEQANGLIGSLATFASEVAPSFRDIVGAASTLGTVALGAAGKVQRLTETATNIAAVTGLSLPQAASNLQRTLAQGIGAADLFRERGVRAIVEAVTGIPNLIAQPLDVVEQAFEDTFGPNGVFGNAATQFATTLPGAISVAGDAIFQFQAALGEAASPSLITFLDLIIRGLNSFRDAITANNDSVDQFIRSGVRLLINGLAGIADIAVFVISNLSKITNVIAALNSSFASFQASIVVALAAVGLASAEAVNAAEEVAREAGEGFQQAAADGEKFREGLEGIQAAIASIRAEVNNTDFGQAAIDRAAAARDPAAEAARQRAFEQASPLSAAALTANEASLKKTVTLLQQIGVETERNRDKLFGEIAALDVQIQKLTAVRTTAGGIVAARERQIRALEREIALLDEGAEKESLKRKLANTQKILSEERLDLAAQEQKLDVAQNDLLARRVALVDRVNVAQGAIPDALTRANAAISALVGRDDERVIKLREQLENMDSQNLSLEKQLETLEKIAIEAEKADRTITKAAADKIAANLIDPFKNAIGQGLRSAIAGEGVEFADTLASLSGELLTNSLNSALDEVKKSVSKLFENLDLGGLGGQFGNALGAAIGVGGAILAGALRDTQTDVKNDLVKTAVDQSREIRGIVAGPTDVPIAQVGNTIRDSFVPIRTLLQRLVQIGEAELALQGGGTLDTSAGANGSQSGTNPLNTAPILT